MPTLDLGELNDERSASGGGSLNLANRKRMPDDRTRRCAMCLRSPALGPLARGFTLIEIMVVLVIVGILLALVQVNFAQDEGRVLSDEANRLGALLQHARDEAMISGRSIGWSAEEASYQFWQVDKEGKWAPQADDEILRQRAFTYPIEWSALTVNGSPIKLSDRVIFTPGGLNAAFEIRLRLKGREVAIRGDPVGRVSVDNIGQG
jgi:general secretion pathway protein H